MEDDKTDPRFAALGEALAEALVARDEALVERDAYCASLRDAQTQLAEARAEVERLGAECDKATNGYICHSCFADIRSAPITNLGKRFRAQQHAKECRIANANGRPLPIWTGGSLRGVDLWRADLCFGNFAGVDMSGANLREASLICAKLEEANLSDADLNSADFTDACLIGANLRGARVNHAVFIGTDVSGADLRDTVDGEHAFHKSVMAW